jgi:hypothetical protein
LANKPSLEDSKEYDVRRKLNKTKSSGHMLHQIHYLPKKRMEL